MADDAYKAIMLQAIGEIKEANKSIAESTKVQASALQSLNDNNILHAEEARGRYSQIQEQLQFLTKRMVYIVGGALIVVILALMGKEYIIPGILSIFKLFL